ncbi:MAG TPA: carboxypeptidase regulatory-like domain-containing protein, partial [Terriglobales bacterium]|nr:carboxypeptidase regulatory-like domain-containing protein [Terriglobales bacterium]
AGSGEIQFRNAKDFLDATFQAKPQNFPALTIGNLPGTVYGVTWNHNLTPKLITDLNIFGNHLILPGSEQSNLTEAANVIYRFAPNWSVNPGEVYAHFSQSSAAGNYSIRTLSFPQQINFDTSHFGASVQYQPTLTSGGYALGQSVRGTSRLTFGTLQLSGYAERQTQALSISSILSQIPALQLELQRLGITISNPQQLSSLLEDTAFLQTLGLSQGAILHIVPVRRQVGGNFSWTSHASRPQQLVLDYVRTTDELLQGSVRNWVQSGSYTHPIGRTNEVFFSYSWFHYPGLNRQYAPLAEVGFRHTFNSLPSFLDPIRHGTVTGIVYLDEQRKGIYGPALPPLEAVEVVLDGVNNTRTDRTGRYAFSGVARGTHTVEVHFRSDHPFWFTSPSTTSADINSVVNFGITFAASELIGFLKNDAGAGVPDVDVDVLGPEQNFKAKSDADGRFALAGLAPGDYTLSVDADSVPPGYVLDEFKPVRVELEKGVPRKAELLLRAVRSLSGEVSYYNSVQGVYVPLANGSVAIPKLALHTRTREDGTFEFTELPAGDYTILLSSGSSSMVRVITVPTGPAHLKEVFRIPVSK